MTSRPLRVRTVAWRIVALLKSEPRGLFTAKEVAARLRLSSSVVRKEIHRLLARDDAPIVKVAHGLFRSFTDAAELPAIETPEPKLHAIQLHCTMPQNRGWGPPAGAPTNWGSLSARPAWTRIESAGQWARDLQFEGRPVVVTVTPSTGTVQASVRCSSHDENLSLREFESFVPWLQGTMTGLGLVWSDPECDGDNLEMNLDYRSLWVSRPDRLSLRKFANAWAQVYQKGDWLRAEVRLTRPTDSRLTTAELVSMVRALAERPTREPAYNADLLPPPGDQEVA